MSTLQLLFLLLILAYLGGFLMGGRGVRGVGLPSGSEWLLAGFLVGPAVLGVIASTDLVTFAPVAVVAVAWIALIDGIGFGEAPEGTTRWRALLGGVVGGAVSFAAVAAAAWAALRYVPAIGNAFPDPHDQMVICTGTAAALSDTSRQALRWAEERLGAGGPLARTLQLFTQGDDLVPLLALGLFVSLDTSRGVPAIPGGNVALGLASGLLAAALLGTRLRSASTAWSLLFGVSLVTAGVAVQADLLAVSTLFVTGLALVAVSPLRATLRAMARHAEGPVLVPVLFIAGTRLPLLTGPALALVAAALGARLLVRALAGTAMALALPEARRAGPAMALALLPAGPLSVAIGLAVHMRYPGAAGATVLAAAAASAVLGEFAGAPALRAAVSPRPPPPGPASVAEGAAS